MRCDMILCSGWASDAGPSLPTPPMGRSPPVRPSPVSSTPSAEVMALGENPRFVVTSLNAPDPRRVYEERYCARSQAENWSKHLKLELASDRTSCTTFLAPRPPANAMRLLQHAAAYVLHQQLRTQALRHTALANAQPSSVISKLFKIAVQVRQCKDRVILHLPTSCPVRQLLQTVTERLFVPTPASPLHSP